MAACEETGTVVCLHVGSSGTSPATAPDAPSDTIGVLFFGYAMFAAVDWLYSRIPVRFPDLRICLSEGGIGWVAGLLDRLEHVRKYDAMYGTWNDIALSPADTFRRNFWVCAIDDPSAFLQRDVIGIENILVESDYPHADSTWPHHAGAARGAARRAFRRRGRARHVGERVGAVPSPGARRGAARPRMPTERRVRRHPVRAGRAAVATARVRALRRCAVRAGRAVGRARAVVVAEPLDATAPGAAPPQAVGGLDLVPGMIAGRRSRSLPHRRDLHARDSAVALPGARVGAGRQLPDRRRVAAHATTAPGSPRTTWWSSGCNYRLGALGWLAADGRAHEPRRCATCAAAVEWLRANVGRVRRRSRPDRADGASRRARARIAHLLATAGDVPVAGAILQSGAAAGTLDAATASLGRRSSSSTPPASTSVDDLRDAPVDALLAAQEQTVVAALGEGRHDAVPPLGRRRPPARPGAPCRAPADPAGGRHHRARDGAVPRPGAGAARGHRGDLPRRQGGQPRHHRRGSGCAPRSPRAAATWSKRSPISSCTCPTSCWRAVTRRAAIRCSGTASRWEAPVRRAATRSTCRSRSAPST